MMQPTHLILQNEEMKAKREVSRFRTLKELVAESLSRLLPTNKMLFPPSGSEVERKAVTLMG